MNKEIIISFEAIKDMTIEEVKELSRQAGGNEE